MKPILLHNTHCSTSRRAVDYLNHKNLDYEIINLIKNPPSVDFLREVTQKLGMKPSEITRKDNKIFKENYAGQTLSEEDYLKIMHEHPNLIQRPILIKGDKAVIGRPTENLDQLL